MSQFSLHKANPTSVTLSRRRFMGLGFWASSLALVGPTSSPQFGQQAMAQGRTDFLGFGDAERSSNARDALLGAKQWLNTAALSTEDLAGKVLLVNFWTYSCINSLRALPYTGEWAGKYGASGLRVIGVHTPEFAFEKDVGTSARRSHDTRSTIPSRWIATTASGSHSPTRHGQHSFSSTQMATCATGNMVKTNTMSPNSSSRSC